MSETTATVPEEITEELRSVDARLVTAPASKAIEWAVDRFGKDLVLAASFQDVVLIDLAVKVDPTIEVVFLDTDAHFPETLDFVEQVRGRYDLNLIVTHPDADADEWPCGTAAVLPVAQGGAAAPGAGRPGGLADRRSSGSTRPTRAAAPVVGWDDGFGLVKVNPLATWTDDDVASYLVDHDLPVHPLVSKGYLLDRLRADDPAGGRGRGPACRAVVGDRQDRVRAARVERCPAISTTRTASSSGAASGRCGSSARTATSAS